MMERPFRDKLVHQPGISSTYVMSHHGANRVWTVNEQVPHPEQAC